MLSKIVSKLSFLQQSSKSFYLRDINSENQVVLVIQELINAACQRYCVILLLLVAQAFYMGLLFSQELIDWI